MITDNIRIKNNITITDKANAIESIVSSYFTVDDGEDGNFSVEYTPYYSGIALINAIVTYFIEGITFEKGDIIYDYYMEDEDLHRVVESFMNTNKDVLLFINENVKDKVDFMKQRLIHSNPDLDKLVEFADVVIDAIGNFANMNILDMDKEDLSVIADMGRKMADKDFNVENLTEVIKDAVKPDIDAAMTEIIDDMSRNIKDTPN